MWRLRGNIQISTGEKKNKKKIDICDTSDYNVSEFHDFISKASSFQ